MSLDPFTRRRTRELLVATLVAAAVAVSPVFVHDVYLQNILVLR